MSEWWLSRGDGKTEGPLSTDALVHGLIEGQIPKRAHVCRVGDQKWVRLSAVDEIWDAANPEQIRTNIIEQPWFLKHPDSVHHRLVDVDADEERTQVLTPLPMINPEGVAHPFVTPLPHPDTSRNLVARQVTSSPIATAPQPQQAAKPADSDALSSISAGPIRAKVPTLDGISDLLAPDVNHKPGTELKLSGPSEAATMPRVAERLEAQRSPSPQLARSAAPKSPNEALLGQQPRAVLAPNPSSSPLGPLKPTSGRTSGLAPLGLAPLGAVPTAAIRPLADPTDTSRLPNGTPLLEGPTSAPGTSQLDAQSVPQNRQTCPRLPQSVSAQEAVHAKFLPGLPNLSHSPHPAALSLSAPSPVKPPASGKTLQPALPPPVTRQPQLPALLHQPAQPAEVAPPRVNPSASSPPQVATSITQPRPLNFASVRPPSAVKFVAPAQGIVLPAQLTPQTLPIEASGPRTTSGAQFDQPVHAAEDPIGLGLELELALTEDDELTTVAHSPSTHKDPQPSIPKQPYGIHLRPTAVFEASADDEATAIVPTLALPGDPKDITAEVVRPSGNGETTILRRNQRARVVTNQGGEPFPSNLASTPRQVAPPVLKSAATPVHITSDWSATNSLLSDPAELLEEGDDEPPAPPKPQVRHSASPRPNGEGKLAPLTASPPSALPTARRPQHPTAPSIVLKAEPIIHQEATQPAVRAMRRAKPIQLSYATLLVVLLAIALVALAVVFVFLRRH